MVSIKEPLKLFSYKEAQRKYAGKQLANGIKITQFRCFIMIRWTMKKCKQGGAKACQINILNTYKFLFDNKNKNMDISFQLKYHQLVNFF